MTEHTIHIERLFDAPVDDVFAAWTDPERRARWYAPRDGWTVTAEIDARVEGSYRITFGPAPDRVVTEEGTFREVIPGERLVYTTILTEANGRTTELVTTVTFEDHDGKTLVTISETGYATPDAAGAHESGWGRFLDRLGKLLA